MQQRIENGQTVQKTEIDSVVDDVFVEKANNLYEVINVNEVEPSQNQSEIEE